MNTPTTDLRKELGAVLSTADVVQEFVDAEAEIPEELTLAMSHFLRTHGQALMDELDGWRPIEDAPHNRKLLIGYHNKLGNWRTVVGTYYAIGTLELGDEMEETEDGFAPAGWYENCENNEFIQLSEEPPTHWRPLPQPPTQEQTK